MIYGILIVLIISVIFLWVYIRKATGARNADKMGDCEATLEEVVKAIFDHLGVEIKIQSRLTILEGTAEERTYPRKVELVKKKDASINWQNMKVEDVTNYIPEANTRAHYSGNGGECDHPACVLKECVERRAKNEDS